MKMANEADIRKEIIKTGILILEKGLVQGPAGISAAGPKKGSLSLRAGWITGP
jgi:hypothetical protein